MKTHRDIKTGLIFKIVSIRQDGIVKCRCIKTGMFCWRNSIKDLMPIEYWMVV